MEEKYYIGVDLGGTTTKIGIVDIKGKILLYDKIDTDISNNGKNILENIAKKIEIMIKNSKISRKNILGIGIGIPGPVDNNGIVRFAVNLGWEEPIDVEKKLEELTEIKVKAANDATLAALGETWLGVAQNIKNAIMITLGTGVGGGIVINGKIVYGATGEAGEIGHIIIDDDEKVIKEKCRCGKVGCLGQYVSANGIVKLAKARAYKLNNSILKEKITSKDIWEKVKEKDEFAIEIAKEFANKMAKAIDMLLKINNPEIIIIGGGMSEAGEIIIDYIKESYKNNYSSTFSNPNIVLAKLGNNAGIIGAVKLVIDNN